MLLGCCLFCSLLLFDSAWWNRGIAEEVTMASYGKAVTGTAVMARSANEKKKISQLVGSCTVSSRGISAPRHAESLHRDRFGQKEEYRVGPAFSGCVMGFSCSTVMIS